jgi:hypothetical protein
VSAGRAAGSSLPHCYDTAPPLLHLLQCPDVLVCDCLPKVAGCLSCTAMTAM